MAAAGLAGRRYPACGMARACPGPRQQRHAPGMRKRTAVNKPGNAVGHAPESAAGDRDQCPLPCRRQDPGFKNTSGAPAKMLLHLCPGAARGVRQPEHPFKASRSLCHGPGLALAPGSSSARRADSTSRRATTRSMPPRSCSARPRVRSGSRADSWVRRPVLLELDADGVVAVLVDILDGVRALGLHPAHPRTGRRVGAASDSNCKVPSA
jgi:hypothetical protein